MPLGFHIKEQAPNFHKFGVLWTPTVLIFDHEGSERLRMEGYMPKNEFRAWLEMSLARLAFLRKDWDDAIGRYGAVIERHPETTSAPEAVYWQGVSRYKKNDVSALGETASALKKKYPGNLWTAKASVWGGE